MSKRKNINKNTQKVIISIVATLIVVIAGVLGISNTEIQKVANQIGLQNITNTTTTTNTNSNTINNVVTDGNLTVYFIDVGQADSILITNIMRVYKNQYILFYVMPRKRPNELCECDWSNLREL